MSPRTARRRLAPGDEDSVQLSRAATEQIWSRELIRELLKGKPRLSREAEKSLARRAQSGDDAARETFVLAQTHVLVRLARLFMHTGVGFDDLLQAGYVGVLRALPRFDPAGGYRFSSYAKHFIYKEMAEVVAELGYAVAMPVREATRLASATRPIQVSVDADELPAGVVHGLRSAADAERCIRTAVMCGKIDVQDSIASAPDELILDLHEEWALAEAIERAMHWFPDEQKEAICSQYGCGYDRYLRIFTPGAEDAPHITLDFGPLHPEVAWQARNLGLSQGRISQLRTQSIRALREGPEGVWLESFRPPKAGPYRGPAVWFWDDFERNFVLANKRELGKLRFGRDVVIYARSAGGMGSAVRQVGAAEEFLRDRGVRMPEERLATVHQPLRGVFVDRAPIWSSPRERLGFNDLVRFCEGQYRDEDSALGWVIIDSPACLGVFDWETERLRVEGSLAQHGWMPLYLRPFEQRPTRRTANNRVSSTFALIGQNVF